MIRVVSAAILPIMVCVYVSGAQDYDIDSQIAKTKRELEKVAQERKQVKDASAKDVREFAEYTSRTQSRFKALAAETDSVRRAVGEYSHKSDSLGALVSSVKTGMREYDLLQKRLRRALISLCEEEIEFAGTLPPAVSKQTTASLSFLKSELATNAIDNVEGLNRLVRIVDDIEDQLMEIQILQGASPVPDIGGTVYRLRIGGVFEAVVSADGNNAAIWSSADSGWVKVDDPRVAQSVLKAVQVREGRSIPVLVELPFPNRKGGE